MLYHLLYLTEAWPILQACPSSQNAYLPALGPQHTKPCLSFHPTHVCSLQQEQQHLSTQLSIPNRSCSCPPSVEPLWA